MLTFFSFAFTSWFVIYSYRENPQITAMTQLVGAYQRREVHEAEKILRGEFLMIRVSSIHVSED